MNFIPFISVKKHIRSLSTAFLFVLTGISGIAQSKEDPDQLKKKISSAENNSQKVEFLLALSNYYLTKPGEFKTDLDSADNLNFEAEKLSNSLDYKPGKGKAILLSAQICREKGDAKKAQIITNKALDYSVKNNLPVLKADVYRELCAYKGYEKEDVEEKIKYLEIAIPLYKKGKAYKKQADALKDLGDYYGSIEENQKALVYLENAVVIYKAIGFKALQGVYTLMSDNYGILQNTQLSLQYALMAEKTAEETHDTSYQLCTIYNHLGLAYYDLLKYDLAFSNFEKALNIALENKNVSDINTISYNLASLYCQQKNYREALRTLKRTATDYPPQDEVTRIRQRFIFVVCYSMLKQMDKAKPYYEQILKDYKESDVGLAYKLTGIIIYLQQSGQVEKTYAYIEKFREFAKKSNKLILYSQVELLSFQSDHASKKYESAIKHLQKHQLLRDSLFNVEKLKQSAALQLQFETEKKDKNIKLLTQQGKLQEIKIHNDQIIRYVFIGSVLVLILFLAFLYNSFRSKKKKNEELEIQRQQINEQNELNKKMLIEKEWLLKEIHHRVKNNLQIVISLLNTQSAYLDNEDALLAIQNSQHRMHAMSLIHQKLYQSDNLANIDMSWYIHELISYMKECFDTDQNINFVLNTEKVYLDVAQAVPLGLIINEAINNAIKYAFPLERKGEVLISLQNMEKNDYQLIVKDNGVGLPDHFETLERNSLGMNLMIGLSDQIDGTFNMENENGLNITITFTRNTEFEGAVENSEII
ncbi:histidine kinase dimerization/phosphoacceptor domain -containing protein [Flavobacterium sp. CLA17]|uniref:tetratricopeptide repeat-containing sensor histidine kinase n=1 Tax=Flavobacterium sp. CLA17 TaxID=2724135 RepID=UPI001491A8CB|nr:histidine kinase dimerization/phosphoacceptor domain -containing protein [Flavobacterium sp. CLA17]QSB25527.1 tetratricopeptide repeat protein [Flavobacterium sp. CLA17]